MPSVLFVCMANICRSPAGAGVLIDLAAKQFQSDLHVDSCGIGDWYLGERTDARMQSAALARGIVLQGRAKLFEPDYFESFDYILAVDHPVLYELYKLAAIPQHKAKVHLATTFSPTYRNQDIPDPFYSDDQGFNVVLDILEDSCEGFLQHLKTQK